MLRRRPSGPCADLYAAAGAGHAAGCRAHRADSAAAGQLGPLRHARQRAGRAVAARPVPSSMPGRGSAWPRCRSSSSTSTSTSIGLPATATNELGIDDVNLSATFAFPLFYNTQTPLLVTPGFAVHYWAGPVSVIPPLAAAALGRHAAADLRRLSRRRLEPVGHGVSLAANWTPASASTAISTASPATACDSRARAWPCCKFSPHMTLKAGVWYLNRVKHQAPARRRNRLDAQPRRLLRHPLSQPENGQAADDLGQHRVVAVRPGRLRRRRLDRPTQSPTAAEPYRPSSHDLVDYDDIRIAVGLDFKTLRQLIGHFEVGFACDRQLNYASGMPARSIPTTRSSSARGCRTEMKDEG